MCAKLLQLCPTLWDPTLAHQPPLSMGFFRQEYWSGLLFPPPGDLPDPGVKSTSPTSLAMVGGFFTSVPFWSTGALKWALASTWQDPHLAAFLLSGTKGQRISLSVGCTSDLVQWPQVCATQGLLGYHFWLKKEMAIHSSTIVWKIPWTEEPGKLQSMGSQRVRRNWATSHTHTHIFGWHCWRPHKKARLAQK